MDFGHGRSGVLAAGIEELQNRGVKDIFIACVDELKGFPRAIERVYPKTSVQLCIVHMVRASLNYVSWKERRLVARDFEVDLSCCEPGRSRAATGRFCPAMG